MSNPNTKDLLSKVEMLEKMINYQDGSVVSRQIIKEKTGNVTIFAFDKDEGLSEHTAPFDAMVYILDGSALITIAKEEFHLKQGEFIVMPADIPHALKAIEKFKMLLVMIKTIQQ
ncbi:MAG: cupin domain-containing protein [Candidatus Heimdallarchaeota archaeon]